MFWGEVERPRVVDVRGVADDGVAGDAAIGSVSVGGATGDGLSNGVS